MYLTGFADEAATDIDGQIRATKALGWKYIEARGIDGKNIHDIPDKDFDAVCGKLQDAGVEINCFGSAIANWAKSVELPFDITMEEVRRAIPRMKRLSTKLVRIMSYPVMPGRGADDQMEGERFRRLREVQKAFSAEGLTPVHENCMNYGGMGWKHTLRLVENVPGLKLVYDTGNPIASDDMNGPPPYGKQSSWEFYDHVKEHVIYVHIKDGVWDPKENKSRYTFPGEGEGDVRRIAADLLKRGYKGGFSIEPHMAVVAHDSSVQAKAEAMFNTYVEYGRRMMRLLDEINRKKP